MKTFKLSVLYVFLSYSIFGQVGFYDGTSQVLGTEKLNSTVCIGFEDINGDFRDDLFLLDKGKTLKTFIQAAPQESFIYKQHLQVSANGDLSIISGDLNNDGMPEIICSGIEDGSQFLSLNGDTYITSFTTNPSPSIYSQNSNLVDLNNDGFLDFFVCHDNGESKTYINNGSGDMVDTKLIDFKTSPEDDMSGNYSSIFTDIDNDNDLDLYIGKCKAGVTDPTDRRRINTLYINNGDGTYTESAEAFGLANGSQTWSVDAGDVDNDGDQDLIIANHDRAHDLMINDGNGHFDRKTIIPGGYSSFAYQSFFCDFDNNGWLDIFITDPSNSFILFNDEMSFTKRDFFQDSFKAFSGATGDLNSDGFPDLYMSFANSFQQPSANLTDKILLNEGNSNNYLDINLIGANSNRDGIGAKIFINIDGETQYREILAGKSYGIMNSTVAHFGIGKSTEVGSIWVKWPSGAEAIYSDIKEINTLLTINENGAITYTIQMPHLQLCGGEAVTAELPEGYDEYNWSNGETGRILSIDNAGWYRAELIKDGNVSQTTYFEVTEELDLSQSEVLPLGDQVACKGDIVKLKAHPGIEYSWSTNDKTQEIDVLESGLYSLTLTTNCGSFGSSDVEVLFSDTALPEIDNDTVLVGESAVFMGEGEELNWYQNKNDLLPIFTGSEFITPALLESQTYYVGEPTYGSVYEKSLMPNVPLNENGDSSYLQNDTIHFSVLEDLTINSIEVRTQKSGIRRFVLLKGNTKLASYEVNLNVGVNKIDIDYRFGNGNYSITSDPLVNQINLETEHPFLSFSEFYEAGDKLIYGYLSIAESKLYPGVSPYFFNWDVSYGHYNCEPRAAVIAEVKLDVSVDDLGINFSIYPNPSSGQVTVATDFTLPFELQIFDVSGRQINQTIISNDKPIIDLPTAPGMYLLKLTNRAGSIIKKVYRY